MIDISIIIPSYNTKDMLFQCLNSLIFFLTKNKHIRYEIIVVDNASVDGTVESIRNSDFTILNSDSKLIVLQNSTNLGFGKAMNKGIAHAKGKYLLFLNSDVIVKNLHFEALIHYLNTHKDVCGLTVRVLLPNGKEDPAAHRGFPSLWRSFCYFSGLEHLLCSIPILNSIFGGYHLCHLNKKNIHEIDSPSGAFFLIKNSALSQIKGFDEDFFMYGEDLDLSFRLKKLGYKIIYYPYDYVLHIKYQSGLHKQKDTQLRLKSKMHFYKSMEIFYRKHYALLYPRFINTIVYLIINYLLRDINVKSKTG